MAPRPRDTPTAPGLLASAFSFVSRELESFTQPQASSSRVTLDGRKVREEGREGKSERERERERERRVKRVRKRSEVDTERARAKRRVREDEEVERAPRATKKRVQVVQDRERSSEREAADDEDEELPVRSLPKALKKRRDTAAKSVGPEVDVDVDGLNPQPQPADRGKKPSKRTFGGTEDPYELMPPPPPPKSMPPPPTPQTTRNSLPFPTMPGSFFERSASLMPESAPTPYRRVVPCPRTPLPPPIIEEETEEEEQTDDQPVASTSNPSPRRGRSRSTGRRKSVDTDRPEPSQERESSEHGVSSRPPSKSRRSIEEPDAEPLEPAARVPSRKGKERAWDTSGEIRVRGKEEELREAREDHARNAHDRDDGEREQDKQRIRILEEEVARLRAELALKSSASVAVMMPPPPPPPPPPLMRMAAPMMSADKTASFLASARANLKHTAPPVEAPINDIAYGGVRTRKAGQPTVNVPSDKMAAFLREMKSVRLRRVGGRAGSMGPPVFPSSAAGDIAGEAGESGVSAARRTAVMGDTSFDTGVAARIFIGEKRKRERDADDELTAGPSKRRETTFVRSDFTSASSSSSSQSSQSSQSSSQSSASSSQSSSTSSQLSVPSSQTTDTSSRSCAFHSSLFDTAPSASRSHTSHAKLTAPLRIWPTRASETDITTPSLCSDNENDHSGHSEDKLPDTPSDSGRGRSVDTVLPREPLPQALEEPEIIDVDALDTPPNVKGKGKSKSKAKAMPKPQPKLKRPPTPHPREPQPEEESDVDVKPQAAAEMAKNAFACRIPESPLPSRSPVKPKPPARAKAPTKPFAPSKLPLPRRVPNPNYVPPPPPDGGSDSDDPLLMTRLPPEGMGGSLFDEEMPGPVAGPSRVSGASSREKGAASTSTASASGHGRSQSLSRSRTHAHAPAQAQAQAPAAANGDRPASRMSNHARRRLTLDEELRRAGDSLWRSSSEEPQQPPSEPEEDLDSGHLVAQGMRSSKSGFLARGGGAGPPVFMGEGFSLPALLYLTRWQQPLRLRDAAHRKLSSFVMAPSVLPKRSPIVLHASTIARAHTYLALSAFLGALLVGCALHYTKIVKNGVAGYPEEWFPSVSATIGDWYPERNIFQILIAVNAGPRFALVALQYYLHRSATSSVPGFLLLVGLLRTLSCGGWVFITSSDDHDIHDVLMIAYIVLNLPWMFGSLAFTPANHIAARSRRRWTSIAFFASLVPMIYFFIQHKVHRIPGAYTHYSFFEWSLILLDVLYDSSAELEFQAADLKITIGNLAGGSLETEKIASDSTPSASTPTPDMTLATLSSGTEKSVRPKSNEAIKASVTQDLYSRLQPTVSFVSDLYLWYVFWSVFTALTPSLFYFSVWELGLSGQELALLSSLSPLFLGIPPFKEWAYSKEGRTVLHVLALIGLGSYSSSSPTARLLLVSFANSAASINAAAEWFDGDDEEFVYRVLVTGLGFLMTSLSKHANHSINPIWPFVNETSGGYNKAGITLALLAITEFAYRAPVQSGPKNIKPVKAAAAAAAVYDTPWLFGALSLGGLIFSLHSLVSDPSTLIAWSWTGYPITGPIPSQHGSLTHLAQALGLGLAALLAGSGSDILAHPLYLALGSASAYVMYTYKDWTGYAGGLGVAAFLTSLIPTVWARARAAAQNGGVAKIAAVAWLVVCIFDVASVFTVAYAFVPGGEYFRERTNMVLTAQFACIALAFRWPTFNTRSLSLTLPKRAQYTVQYALAVFSALSLLATLYHTPIVVPKPHRPGPRIVRAGIWTVHFGIDNRGRDSQRLMRDLIKDMELDVVGLLETDLHRVTFGNRDLTRIMAEELGFYVDIGPGPNQHTWGAVLLSKFPIINSTHHLLPSPDGELAPAIEAFLDMYGTPVKVIVSHNGQEETPLDRELQATELARMMSESYPNPVIFLGYVVTDPHARRPAPYQIMVEDGKVFDIDDDDADRWCEYIFYRGLYRTSYARLSRGIVTDTELQVGQFVVPRYKEAVNDTSRELRFLRSFKEWLPEDHWFPMEYYPELGGKNGHHYHVFNTPLYYRLPEEAL
ncbi:hypothetical protein GSI_08076 [Ganoderma sinense ZZ0214-1]|uniref:Uncharacterized protein n=1 Tax=Ganoderma sinense ZZ0214-1 TaxID=1077348 RepID=A0A2G8S7W7_9APHY|nr:hypothetical protein GSI_08076 [Ganoderma sinense ZZ0214-1]